MIRPAKTLIHLFRALLLSAVTVALVVADTRGAQNVVVILDDSGSMGGRMRSQRRITRMEAAKQALITVLEQLPEDAHVGVALLNHRDNPKDPWIIPLGPVNIDDARRAVQRVSAEGGTPLGQFLKLGADELLRKRAQDHYGTYRLLVVTDGEANDAVQLEAYLPDVLSRGIVVDVIGVDMDSDHSLATKVNTYRRADDADSLTAAVREVFAETSGGTGDAGEDDFELLQGLPAEVAQAALTALAESGNQPIGAQPGDEGEEPSSLSSGQLPSPPRPPGGQARRSRFPWLLALVLAYVVISIIRTAVKKKR